MSTLLEKSIYLPRGDSIESSIGNTPLIRLRNISRDLPPGVKLLAKAEHLNPGGSVKDRAALWMILEGERSGRLQPGMTILDATSGNTGIAYGMIGSARGYPVTICLPKNASAQRKRILRSFGVELIETNPLQSTDGAQLIARELSTTEPQKYFYPDQYNNAANLHGLEGLKHMATALVPGIYDRRLADGNVEVSTEDGHAMARRLAQEEGLLVGASSGANVFAALRLALSVARGSVVVTILCDGGER